MSIQFLNLRFNLTPLSRRVIAAILIAGFTPVAVLTRRAYAQEQPVPLRVQPNFEGGKPVPPSQALAFTFNRTPAASDGRIAVFIGSMDISALCIRTDTGLAYSPAMVPLPTGESAIVIYLVSAGDNWTEVGRFPLLVEVPRPAEAAVQANPSTASPAEPPAPAAKSEKPNPFQFVPRLSVNVKGQSTALFFPESNRPTRLNFLDVAAQSSLQGNYTGNGFTARNQIDLVGSTVQAEALRFGDLGNRAMQVDLSSYLMDFTIHKVEIRIGQISFGSDRHLINNFSSRGISVTVPITNRFDVSGAMMNGTSIVGFNNFFGLSIQKHRMESGTIGVEIFPKRRGALRIEFTGLRGSLLPRNNFNQATVTDAERSFGGSIRVIASDAKQRFHFDGSFARSKFTNPADPLLYQGRNVVPVRAVTRDARYLDVSYELLRAFKFIDKRTLNLTVSYHHERADPLYRSIAAFTQADRLNNQADILGNLGGISFNSSYSRSNDDLAGIRSILKTETRHFSFNISGSPTAIISETIKPSRWIPRLAFSYDSLHQAAAFVPINGDFFSLTQIPNQKITSENFSADWQLTSKIRTSYRFNYSFQDNLQIGRERGDFANAVNSVNVGWNATKKLDLNFDFSAERTSIFEQNTGNNTFRFGPGINYRLSKTMTFGLTASTTGAGDRRRTNDRRDVDLDVQYSWLFLHSEKDRWRKMQGQFFVRYANRYGRASDRLFNFISFTKLQTFNAGLNFTFF